MSKIARPTRRYYVKSLKTSESTLGDEKKSDAKLDEAGSVVCTGKFEEGANSTKKPKTILEQDEELRLKLEGISGEGGGAGVEYEGGKAVGLKRGVRENMFRVI